MVDTYVDVACDNTGDHKSRNYLLH